MTDMETKYFKKYFKGYSFLLKSQKWLDESIYYIENDGPDDPERCIWKHWVNVWVPKGKKLDKDLIGKPGLFNND